MAGTIGDTLKKLRETKGLSMAFVAKQLDLSLGAYQKYENNTRDVSTSTLNAIADFYGVTTDYLLGRTETKPDPIKQLTDEELEQNVLQEYLQLPKSVRMQILQAMSRAFECSQEAKHESQIHISRTAARNGALPRKELLTQEEVDAIKARPDADPDL